MALLDTVPITSCHECVAMLTLPLALFLLLAETAVGGFGTVAYLRLTGGLTHGFLKFIAVTYAILGGLAFLVVLAGPPGSYHSLLAINQPAAQALLFLQGVLVLALIAHAVVIWRRDASTLSWALTLSASALLLAGIAAALWPLAGSLLNGAAIALGAGGGVSAAGGGGAGVANLPPPVVYVYDRPALPGDDRHPARPAAGPAPVLRRRRRLIALLPVS